MKNTEKITIIVLLLLLFVLTGGVIFVIACFNEDPPMGEVICTDLDEYLKVNRYVRKKLKNECPDMFPNYIPANCTAEYLYDYSCNFDGDVFLTIYLETKFSIGEDYDVAKNRINTNDVKMYFGKEESTKILVTEAVSLENYFQCSKKYYTGYSAAIIKENDKERTIQYLFIAQSSNFKELDTRVVELLSDLEKVI